MSEMSEGNAVIEHEYQDEVALSLPTDELKKLWERYRIPAIRRYITGKTPKRAIKEREGPKDRNGNPIMLKYVPAAWLIREMSLVTGFKWSHKVLSKKTLPDWGKAIEFVRTDKKESYTKDDVVKLLERIVRNIPREIITDIELTIYDAQDRAFIHTATGTAEVEYLRSRPNTPVSIGNAEKSSETDAIRKAAANAGWCPDVFGPREIFEEEAGNPESPES